jgi:hypothetical protein
MKGVADKTKDVRISALLSRARRHRTSSRATASWKLASMRRQRGLVGGGFVLRRRDLRRGVEIRSKMRATFAGYLGQQ